jgi:Flp pilus assembly protein protease CpaA
VIPCPRIVGDAVCLVLCAAAAAIDLRTHRIPNALTLPALAAGLLMAATGGAYDLAGAAIAALLLGGLFALFALVGGVGWGDAKLMAAVGALLGWPLVGWPIVLHALAYTAIAGGVVALGFALRRRRLRATFRGILAMARQRRVQAEASSGVVIPYALAIALGSAWAIVGRYVPALLLG